MPWELNLGKELTFNHSDRLEVESRPVYQHLKCSHLKNNLVQCNEFRYM